jgi:hypothetical protein
VPGEEDEETGGREVRMCGSSMVNESWRSVSPEYGVHEPWPVGLYLEMCAV